MKVIRRLCQIRDLHVAILMLAIKLVFCWEDSGLFVAKLQIPFHTATAMLWNIVSHDRVLSDANKDVPQVPAHHNREAVSRLDQISATT